MVRKPRKYKEIILDHVDGNNICLEDFSQCGTLIAQPEEFAAPFSSIGPNKFASSSIGDGLNSY